MMMTNSQSYNGTPKLKVNDFDAVNIKRINGRNAARYEWAAGQVVMLSYTGGFFVISGGGVASTTYYGKTKLSSAIDSTSEALAATPNAVKQAYDLAASKATVHRFTATIPTTGWTQSGSLYYASVTVSGVLATDQAGSIGPVQTGTESTDKAMRSAWNKVVRITAAANAITVYATAVPSASIPILMEVMR